ncbi:non-specific serine/threonine protein kinase [Salvia divinorum]|uniref:non-specific serine/threonine protein kinase n=1 Tax=Salvia divinorum TaxID=28513 RepID=A0ABD1G183_SALDI
MNGGCLPLILLAVFGIPSCVVSQPSQFETCRQPFRCGGDISYPFYGGDRPVWCGAVGYEMSCRDDVPLINTSSLTYRVLDIDDRARTLRVARDDLWSGLCAQTPQLRNTTIETTLFNFYQPSNDQNISLIYGCTAPPLPTLPPNQFECSSSAAFFFIRAVALTSSITCAGPEVTVRVTESAATGLESNPSIGLLQTSLQGGFSIQWSVDNQNCQRCSGSGGACGSNVTSGSFVCYCANNASFPSTCTIGSSVCALALFLSIYFGKNRILQYLRKNSSSNSNVEQFLLNHASLSQKRYSYYEIKKMTKFFKDKVGQGGYGIVYKGELLDGQPVAVKVLTDPHDDDAQEFINEVASISETSHVNIVRLLGFCFERKKRALVYEFMPNKSLDKFIYSRPGCSLLGLDKLHVIALGVARGLEYMHTGCNTRILHFDIKPQNILLDEDFCPKISDFGLAKLFKKKQSKISLLGTRGTIGYIAPEVFSRNFGVVSHKSDVYSYGMMLLEMVGAKEMPKTTEPIIQSSESDFHESVYELVLAKKENIDDLMRDEKQESKMKMLMVGVWCIQTAPSDRPSISKVVEMLQGSVQSIEMPPKPSFPSALLLDSLQFSSSIHIETQ